MKKCKGIILVGCIVFIIASYFLFNMYLLLGNKKETAKILKQAYSEISISNDAQITKENFQDEIKEEHQNDKNVINFENGIIGVLVIPKLNIEAPIKDGTSQEVLKTSVGHFTESNYWNGNVSFASHNGGVNAHFFEKINQLNENDEIEYLTKLGRKKYKVNKVIKIDSTDWTEIYKTDKNNKNTITLITCINGYPHKRLCVKGEEIKNL